MSYKSFYRPSKKRALLLQFKKLTSKYKKYWKGHWIDFFNVFWYLKSTKFCYWLFLLAHTFLLEQKCWLVKQKCWRGRQKCWLSEQKCWLKKSFHIKLKFTVICKSTTFLQNILAKKPTCFDKKKHNICINPFYFVTTLLKQTCCKYRQKIYLEISRLCLNRSLPKNSKTIIAW